MPERFDQIDDEKLLALYYKTLDQKWLGILLERYTLLLLGVCLKYLKQKDKAEDAVQQVFLKTLSAASHTQIRNIGAWLYQVARNECFSLLRAHQDNLPGQIIEEIGLSENSDFLKDWQGEEWRFEQLDKAIEALNTSQKDCIRLFYLKGKSYKEIADLLHLSIKEVKSHIQNGKRNLKNRLHPAFFRFEKGGHHE